MPQTNNTTGQAEVSHLRSQNDQLWKIIEKQRVMIQNLQKDNVRLSAERDGLQEQVVILEKELARKHQITSLLISPHSVSEDDLLSTPSTETIETASPIPPPRSPYRVIKDKSDEFLSLDTMVMNKEPENFRGNTIDELHDRSSPNSPAPTNKQRKERSPYGSVSPSKSSSSLETRKNSRQSIAPRDQERSVHSVSPTIHHSPTSMYPQKQDDDQLHLGNMANIRVKVVASHIKPNEKGKEVVSFIIAVGSLTDDERWRVEKLYSDFLALDAKLKTHRNKSVVNKIGKLPDKTLFSNNAPTKVDQRKVALEQYLQHVISLSLLEDISDLCEFLNSDVIDTTLYQTSGQKEGYLTKRGKNFGGWKTRYFVVNENALEYYESKDGVKLGSIRLTNAQIGTQVQGSAQEESVYRHAFLLVEQKRVGSTNSARHILCANSDDDRDSWIHAILQCVDVVEDDAYHQKCNKKKVQRPSPPTCHVKLDNGDPEKPVTPQTDSSTSNAAPLPLSAVQTWSYDLARATSMDQNRPRVTRRSSMSNLSSIKNQHEDQLNQNDASSILTSRTEDDEKKKRNKRMTFWGRRMFSGDSLHEQPRTLQLSSSATSNNIDNNNNNSGLRGFLSRSSHESNQRKQSEESVASPAKPANQVFGIPLEEAVRISRVAKGYELPAIVYRCIEYLDAMNAVLEEGLYRLSGSNAMMKALCERFNQEGDVDLLASDEYDVHVVAGLLKMWLRELPTSVLTREHRAEFLHVIDLLDRKDRVNELGRLVSLLPLANYTLLRALTAHLIRVVQHSDINKMTMRNVSIVFSPTLGIPATILNLLMSEFEYVFWITKDGDAAPRKIEEDSTPILQLKEEHGRSNRNSVNYMDGAPNAIVDLEKNMEGSRVLNDDDDVDDLTISTDYSYS